MSINGDERIAMTDEGSEPSDGDSRPLNGDVVSNVATDISDLGDGIERRDGGQADGGRAIDVPRDPVAMLLPSAEASESHTPSPRHTLVPGLIGLFLGLALGAGIVAAATLPELQSAKNSVSELSESLADTRDELSEVNGDLRLAEIDLGVAARAQAALSDRDAELRAREEAVKAQEEDLVSRQAAIESAEQQVALSSFAGGVHVVGKTVAPGTYMTSGVSNCYYAWKSGTSSSAEIIDNNIVDGTVTVTLNDGDVFESSRCGKWTKVG